jgi:hypothetical protein
VAGAIAYGLPKEAVVGQVVPSSEIQFRSWRTSESTFDRVFFERIRGDVVKLATFAAAFPDAKNLTDWA